MALVTKELFPDRTGSESITDNGIEVAYTRTFVVYHNSALLPDNLRFGPKTAIDEVKSFTGAALGDIYSTPQETDNRAILQSFEATKDDTNVITVTMNYSSQLNVSPPELIENPLQRPPRISAGTNSYSVTKREDENGKPVINSAKDPFDPLPQVNEVYGKFSIQRNFPQDNYNILVEFANTVNSTQFYQFDAGSLRITDFTQNGPLWENGYMYWDVKVDFEHRPNKTNIKVSGSSKDVDGWNTLELDAGYNEISGTTTTAIKDADGKDTTVPRPLDGSGSVLTAFTASDVSYEEFQFHARKDFNTLGII